MISQSAEFGGIGAAHDIQVLIERYVDCQPEPVLPDFVRGDINSDDSVNIADAVFLLNDLFGDGAAPTCDDAADANDDGSTNIADSIFLLNQLFGNGDPIPEPFPDCGIDPTGDGLDCASSPCP